MVPSDIAGYRNIVRDGLNGVHVPPYDPHALSGQCPPQHEGRARRAQGDAPAHRHERNRQP
jgi:hypothetical protein